MTKMNVRKGDNVKVLSGKDAGATGEVIAVKPEQMRIAVSGVALVKKAQAPTPANPRGGIVTKEAFIDSSNVQLVCPECGKATRVGHSTNAAGKRVRVCKKCGAEF